MSPRPYPFGLALGRLLLIGALAAPLGSGAAAPTAPGPAEAGAAPDAAQPGAETPQAAQPPAPTRFLTLPLEALTPMQREIRLCIEQEQRELAQLSAAYATSKSDEEARSLQKQIHAVKSNAERSVLQIQLAWARAEARQEAVVELEQALALLERGGLQRQRADRPTPGKDVEDRRQR